MPVDDLGGAVDEIRADATRLALKAEHYASAFRHAAHVCRSRASADRLPDVIAHILEEKAAAEDDLARRLRDDPIGTYRAEGLL